MNDQKGVTIRESVTVQQERREKFYSDDEIRDLFDDDADCLVIALLNRAQAVEAEIERLRERHDEAAASYAGICQTLAKSGEENERLQQQCSNLTDRWECDCAFRDAEIERLRAEINDLRSPARRSARSTDGATDSRRDCGNPAR